LRIEIRETVNDYMKIADGYQGIILTHFLLTALDSQSPEVPGGDVCFDVGLPDQVEDRPSSTR
jgi:hypothetical protein